jgi:acyl-coenzyme A thioesterase PaaI-like protein
MSRITAVENVSLDGVMQAPGQPDEDRRGGFAHGGWAVAYSDDVSARIAGRRAGTAGRHAVRPRHLRTIHGRLGRAHGQPVLARARRAHEDVVSNTLGDPLP